MLRIQPAHAGGADLAEIEALYLEAFPARERQPFSNLLNEKLPGCELLALYDGAQFVGFASLLTLRDLTHILYFAVDPALRDRGYGSKALAALHAHRAGNRFLADVETQRRGADNNEQRRRRMAFYLRNGYHETDVRYRWQRESYEILVHGGALTEAEFDAFWDYFDHLAPGRIS